MLCPTCGEDTNPTFKFCQFCNSVLEIDFERAGAALAFEDEEAIKDRAEQRITGIFYLSIFILLIALALRFILDRPVKIEHTTSYSVPMALTNQIKPPERLPFVKKAFELPK